MNTERGDLFSCIKLEREQRHETHFPILLHFYPYFPILLLLDRLEPDKGKQTRLLTEHLTGQRALPYTEQGL